MEIKTSDFDYELPTKYIAQSPLEPRDSSRLLILDRRSGEIEHSYFYRLGEYLQPSDLLVLNETRVIPARIFGRKIPTGGKVELLLLNQTDALTWMSLVGGKGLDSGKRIAIENGLTATVLEVLPESRRLIRFNQPVEHFIEKIGHTPLPPYIHKPLENPERYQTIYAKSPGSSAAPTAGLHFTVDLLKRLNEQGIQCTYVSLHIGLDTFAPVKEQRPTDHEIHTEWCEVSEETASAVHQCRAAGGRIIAVGTTSVRALETVASHSSGHAQIQAFSGPTGLYILPGYQFKIVDAMITNFHLPRSTLIMLVSAFANRELILNAYEEAKAMGYRFYSFGDAMLIK